MSFEQDLQRFAVKTQARIDDVVRHAVVLAAQGVVLKSPVGNPELWKVNDNYHAMKDVDARVTYNLFVDEANATRADGEKKMRKLGKKRMAEGLKLQHSDYVGGRFRANWILGIGAPDTTTTEDTDKSGGATIQKIAAAMQGEKAGKVHYITNSLVYGPRLEYEGWSSQAPAGMVRVTFAELPGQIESYAASLNR